MSTARLEFNDIDFDDAPLQAAKQERRDENRNRLEILETFKNMLLEPNLDFRPCMDDNFLMRFLRASKFRCGIAAHRLRSYYHHRSLHPDIFATYYPSATSRAQALNYITALPYRAKDYTAVIIVKLGRIDFSEISFEEVVRLQVMVLETLLMNPVTQLCDITAIVDFDGFSYQQIGVIIPSYLPTCYDVFHSYSNLRLKYLHLVNTPGLVYTFQEYGLSFLREKIKNRIAFYPVNANWDRLHRHIPPDVLPEEYGGTLDSAELVDVNAIVNDEEEYFRNQLQYRMLNQDEFNNGDV